MRVQRRALACGCVHLRACFQAHIPPRVAEYCHYTSIHICMHVHAHTDTHTHAHTHAHTHTDTHTDTHAHTHAHTRTHTNTHACTHLSGHLLQLRILHALLYVPVRPRSMHGRQLTSQPSHLLCQACVLLREHESRRHARVTALPRREGVATSKKRGRHASLCALKSQTQMHT